MSAVLMASTGQATVPIVTVAGRKGGSGKTTLTLHLAGALAERGRRVLVVDLDAQASLTRLMLKAAEINDGIGDRILNRKRGLDGLALPAFPNVDIFPGNRSIETAEFTFASDPRAAFYLRNLLGTLQGYDVALVDTPPALGFALHSGLLAAQLTILPTLLVQQDLDALADTIGLQRDYAELGGASRMLIVPNNYRPDREEEPVLGALAVGYPDVVVEPIAHAVAIKNANNAGEPVVVRQKHSRAAKQYRALAQRLEREIGYAE
jgi:chromosome partitioning protein